jgi:hypothetical protein
MPGVGESWKNPAGWAAREKGSITDVMLWGRRGHQVPPDESGTLKYLRGLHVVDCGIGVPDGRRKSEARVG